MTETQPKQIDFSWDRVICQGRSQAFNGAYQSIFPKTSAPPAEIHQSTLDGLSQGDIFLLNATLSFRKNDHRAAIEACRLFLQTEPENLAVALFLLYSITAIGASSEDFLTQPIAGWAANFPEFPLAVVDCAHARGNEPLAYRVMTLLNFVEGDDYKRDALFRSSLVVFDRETAENYLDRKEPTIRTMEPFQSLLVRDQPELHLACALNEQELTQGQSEKPYLPAPPTIARARLKVGYVSPDFRMHPTTLLLWKMFELHDEKKFDIQLLSTLDSKTMANANELMRGGIDPWLDHFKSTPNFRILSTHPREREHEVRSLELDLLIDLNGHARGGCQSLFRRRPARVQAAYLGYPGTTGNPEIDYLIADDIVVFDGNRVAFTETVISLPGFYQINSYRHFASVEAESREQYGLPVNGVVFCSFNATHKITGEIFNLWCDILEATPGSVLWLLRENELQVSAMSERARMRGLDHARLVFAEKWHFLKHLSRLGAADIMLDSFPYGGHTTAVDAAWCAVPCVTRYGQSFHSRVAMSMNKELGLEELNCPDSKTYFETTLNLARDPKRLTAIKTQLNNLKFESSVFDTETKTRDLEKIFLQIT